VAFVRALRCSSTSDSPASTGLLCKLGGLRPRRHDLGEVVPPLRDRVEPCVDTYSERAARQGLDLTPHVPAGLCRGGHGATVRAGSLHVGGSEMLINPLTCVPPAGLEPAT
jgi:hypothetical protein